MCLLFYKLFCKFHVGLGLRKFYWFYRFLKQDDKFEPLKEIERLEEEEREVEEQMVFEEKFNYRFENLDENFVSIILLCFLTLFILLPVYVKLVHFNMS